MNTILQEIIKNISQCISFCLVLPQVPINIMIMVKVGLWNVQQKIKRKVKYTNPAYDLVHEIDS